MKTITVKVIKDDIAKGCRNSSFSCPIALALCRVLPGYRIDVSRRRGVMSDPNFPLSQPVNFLLPENATTFIDLFDGLCRWDCWEPVPFEFTLEVPDHL